MTILDASLTQVAVASPARTTSRLSLRKSSCSSISRRITWRLEMLTPIAMQQHGQALDRDVVLVILHRYEAAQLRAEMTEDVAGQRRQDRLTLWRQPTFATVAHHPRAASTNSCTW
jgi:hypothetical protein